MEVKKNDVIQANENAGIWCGCLLIVDAVKSWGVQAWMIIPNRGKASIRLSFDQFERIGVAALIAD